MKIRSIIADKHCVARAVYFEGPVGESQVNYLSQCSRKVDILNTRKMLLNLYLSQGDLQRSYDQMCKIMYCKKSNVTGDPVIDRTCSEIIQRVCKYLNLEEYRLLLEYKLLVDSKEKLK